MDNLNFFDPGLHEIIKKNAHDLRVRILPYEGPEDQYQTNTQFTIGDQLLNADAPPDVFYHCLLKPLLAHFPNQVMIDDHPLNRRPFVPQVQHIHRRPPSPLEERLYNYSPNFSQFQDVGVIIDGITYLPPHPIWNYQVTAPDPRHSHWNDIVKVAVYPFVDLGNPPNIDPSHPENIAEVLSRAMAPQYCTPDWISHQRSPHPSTVYQTWTPQDTKTPWMPQSLPIIVNAIPTLIEVEDQPLAFAIAHALFNQPELGLVPILDPKPGQHHITLTCPDPHAITTVDVAGCNRSMNHSFPPPDGPLHSISVPCKADATPIIVNPTTLFIEKDNKQLVYSTGHQRLDEDTLAFMAASAFAGQNHYPKAPEDFLPHAIQALYGARQAHHHLMMKKAYELETLQRQLTTPADHIRAHHQPWTIEYQPQPEPQETQ